MHPGSLHTEKELLRKIAKGDEAAFRIIYDQYRDRIYSTSFKLLHSTVLAEEIVQDVFLKCWLKRETLTQIDYFSTWLTGIARHCSFAAFNKIARQGLAIAENEITWLPDNRTDEAILGKDYHSVLQEAIKRLSSRQAQVYRLNKEQGYNREEIAAIMNLSPETVKAYLADAVRLVRLYCLANMEIPLFLLLSSPFLIGG